MRTERWNILVHSYVFKFWLNILCPFSKAAVMNSSLEAMSSPAIGSWPYRLPGTIYSCPASKARGGLLLHNIRATTVPINISCPAITTAAHRIHCWVRLPIFLPRQSAQHLLWKQQGESFQISTSLISSCPMIKLCDIYSNTLLPPSYGGQEQWQ